MEQEQQKSNNSRRKDDSQSAPQDGVLQWNLLAWFGASFGSSVWMMLTPFLLEWPAKGVFAGVVGTLLIWSYASLVWGLRSRISAFKGIVGLLCLTVLANLGFLLFAHANGLSLEESSQRIETDYRLYYGALLFLFLFLLILFWLKERRNPE